LGTILGRFLELAEQLLGFLLGKLRLIAVADAPMILAP
jgi:hypothetical protein